MCLVDAAKLLGVWVGPDAGDRTWLEVRSRVARRLREIKSLHLGIASAAVLFNSIAFATAGYVISIVKRDAATRRWFNRSFQLLTAAPIYAFPNEVLVGLDKCGVSVAVKHFSSAASAAMFRAAASSIVLHDAVSAIGVNFNPDDLDRFLSHPSRSWVREAVSINLFDSWTALGGFCDIAEAAVGVKVQAKVYNILRAGAAIGSPGVGLLRRI